MIQLKTYLNFIKEVLLLVGQTSNEDQIRAIYERIKHHETVDFIKACSDDKFLYEWSIRVNYPSLKNTIEKHMIERLEREERERRRKEREALRKKFKREELPEAVIECLRKIKTL